MAIFHLHSELRSRKSGGSACEGYRYIAREARYKNRDKLIYLESKNMPSWAAQNPREYWDAADLRERKNGTLFRYFEIALPAELSVAQQLELAKKFTQKIAIVKGGKLPYSWAIHAGHGQNPHFHLMMSERINDGISRPGGAKKWFKRASAKGRDPASGGARKAIELGRRRKDFLLDTRKLWADMANISLKMSGSEARISHESLAKQGFDRLPQIHEGAGARGRWERGLPSERIKINQDIKELNNMNDRLGGTFKIYYRGRYLGVLISKNNMIEAGPELSDKAGALNLIKAAQARGWTKIKLQGNTEFKQFAAQYARSQGLEIIGEKAKKQPLPSPGKDRTAQAVYRQIMAMNCEKFDIGIRDSKSGKMMNREWPATEIIKNIKWLKLMNRRQNDIYIRPAQGENHGLILLDDLEKCQIGDLGKTGILPVVDIETSPKNHQVWIKIGDEILPEIRGKVAKILSKKFDSDPNSADSRHYGRLAGFTNCKQKHIDKYGQSPFCLLRKSTKNPVISPAATGLIAEAQSQILEEKQALPKLRARSAKAAPSLPAAQFFRQELDNILSKFGSKIDPSRADFQAAKKMALSGYSSEIIKKTLREYSPNLAERKKGHIEDYLDRTTNNVFSKLDLKKRPESGPEPVPHVPTPSPN